MFESRRARMVLSARTWLFILSGVLGIFGEVVFTALQALWRTRSPRLMGFSFIWMFPIYGLIAILYEPVHDFVWDWHWLFRGLAYTVAIYAAEYASGALLKKALRTPVWQYTGRWQFHGHIRLAHAPVWFAVGLLVEKIYPDAMKLAVWLAHNI